MTCWRSCTARSLAAAAALLSGPARAGDPTAATTAAPSAEAALPTLEGLLGRLAALPGIRAKFREEKRMALLAAPLVNEGVLYFHPPGRLARHTTAPMRASVVIEGGRLTFGDERGVEVIRVDGNPAMALFVDSFVKIFAGDRDALVAMYDMAIEAWPEGGAEGWRLTLRPKVAPIDRILARIEIEGAGVIVRRMRVVEVGGDEAVTTFSEVDVSRAFSAAEQAALFRVEARR